MSLRSYFAIANQSDSSRGEESDCCPDFEAEPPAKKQLIESTSKIASKRKYSKSWERLSVVGI